MWIAFVRHEIAKHQELTRNHQGSISLTEFNRFSARSIYRGWYSASGQSNHARASHPRRPERLKLGASGLPSPTSDCDRDGIRIHVDRHALPRCARGGRHRAITLIAPGCHSQTARNLAARRGAVGRGGLGWIEWGVAIQSAAKTAHYINETSANGGTFIARATARGSRACAR